MKSLARMDDPVISVVFSPGYLRRFLRLPPLEAWNLFGGDVPSLRTDHDLPADTALLTYGSGAFALVNLESNPVPDN